MDRIMRYKKLKNIFFYHPSLIPPFPFTHLLPFHPSTGHQYRRQGRSLPFPTQPPVPSQTVVLCSSPHSLHRHVRLHVSPSPHNHPVKTSLTDELQTWIDMGENGWGGERDVKGAWWGRGCVVDRRRWREAGDRNG